MCDKLSKSQQTRGFTYSDLVVGKDSIVLAFHLVLPTRSIVIRADCFIGGTHMFQCHTYFFTFLWCSDYSRIRNLIVNFVSEPAQCYNICILFL